MVGSTLDCEKLLHAAKQLQQLYSAKMSTMHSVMESISTNCKMIESQHQLLVDCIEWLGVHQIGHSDFSGSINDILSGSREDFDSGGILEDLAGYCEEISISAEIFHMGHIECEKNINFVDNCLVKLKECDETLADLWRSQRRSLFNSEEVEKSTQNIVVLERQLKTFIERSHSKGNEISSIAGHRERADNIAVTSRENTRWSIVTPMENVEDIDDTDESDTDAVYDRVQSHKIYSKSRRDDTSSYDNQVKKLWGRNNKRVRREAQKDTYPDDTVDGDNYTDDERQLPGRVSRQAITAEGRILHQHSSPSVLKTDDQSADSNGGNGIGKLFDGAFKATRRFTMDAMAKVDQMITDRKARTSSAMDSSCERLTLRRGSENEDEGVSAWCLHRYDVADSESSEMNTRISCAKGSVVDLTD